jgi:predicted MFS family arabinose efflux permease
VRLALVAAMAALAYAGSPSIPVLYVLTFVVGLGHSVFWPSITALLQEVIRPDQLTAASGLAEITWQVGNLTGAALGGPILVRFGLGTAFAIDAATYLVSALALLALHHRPAPAEGPHESGLAMAREGVAYLRRHPAVAGFGIASVIPWVATISLNVVLVAYVLDVLHLGATAYGLADMTYGVGAMVSGIFAALLVLRLGEWRAMTCVLVALIGCCYAILAGVPAAVPVFYAVLFLAGFCSSAFRVMTTAYLFKVVPNDVHGTPVVVVPARVDGAPGRRDAVGRSAHQPHECAGRVRPARGDRRLRARAPRGSRHGAQACP